MYIYSWWWQLFTHESLEPEFPKGNSWQNLLRTRCQVSTECVQYQSGREEIIIQGKLSFKGKRPRSPKELRWTTWTQVNHKGGCKKRVWPNPEHKGQREAVPQASQSQSNSSLLSWTTCSFLTSLRMWFFLSAASCRLAWKLIVIFKSRFLCQMTDTNTFNS